MKVTRSSPFRVCVAWGVFGVGVVLAVQGAAAAFQEYTPPVIPDFACELVTVGAACSAESQSTSCPSSSGICTYCNAPNANALVSRCVADRPNQSCVHTYGDPHLPYDIDCGMSYYGECDGNGSCVDAIPSTTPCNATKSRGCKL